MQSIEQETWRPIVGYEGLYEVSNLGNVKSLRAGRILRDSGGVGGYRSVGLTTNGHKRTVAVHRMVLEAFVGACPDGYETRHLDGNPTNNRLTNLRWGTHMENTRDQDRHGTGRACRTQCPRGHDLRAPNLRPNQKGRSCKACDLAQKMCKRRGIPFDTALADERYREIIES